MNTNWYDVDDMARVAKVHKRTVQKWCREQIVPHMRIGRTIRFTEEQIREAEAAYTREPVVRLDVYAPNPSYQPRPVVVPMKPRKP